jgi:hypothetical protein
MTSVADLCDGVVILISYLESCLADYRKVDSDKVALVGAVCSEAVVPLGAARLLRLAKQTGPVRQTQVEDLESQLTDARQALTCLAGITLTDNRHPPTTNDPPEGPRSA